MKQFSLAFLVLATLCCAREKAEPAVPAAEPTPVPFAQVPTAPTKKQSSRDRIQAKLEALAKEASVDVLAKKDKLMADAVAEHDADVASYHYRISRWGDWLEVSIARGDADKAKPAQKVSTSINLGLVTTVRLEPGHGPDLEGEVSYRADYDRDKPNPTGLGGSFVYCNEYYESDDPPAGYHWKVYPLLPEAPYRALFHENEKAGAMAFNGGGAFGCGYGFIAGGSTKNMPRFAQDDVIHFDGIAEMYVPAGLGEKVYREILNAKDSSTKAEK